MKPDNPHMGFTALPLEPLPWHCQPPGVTAFSTRRGTTDARNPYSQYNLCDYVGDDALRVLDARLLLCQQLGIDLDHLVLPRQTHGTRVLCIDDDFLLSDIDRQEAMLEGVDGLVTSLTGVCLGVNTADCVAVAVADPVAGIIGVAHAGWRGTVERIAARLVEAMTAMGAHPEQMQATMGPSICRDCFEVGHEVGDAFEAAHHQLDEIAFTNPDTGKLHIDLRRANALVLRQAGLADGNIATAAHCSRCENDAFFSARRQGTDSGRTLTALMRHNSG